jgi:hypothetical protein
MGSRFSMLACALRRRQQPPQISGSFIDLLAVDDDVCSADASNLEYGGLQKLICNGDMDVVDMLPNYALIIAAYYLMFRRRDFTRAVKLLDVLKDLNLSPREEEAVSILDAARMAAPACDVKLIRRTAATGWVALFKELVMLHFATAEAAEKAAKRLKRRVPFPRYSNGRYVPDPIFSFIYHAADRAHRLPACQPRANAEESYKP